MIKKLNNSDVGVSNKIYAIFQVSYKLEARLLNASDFPPLKRTSQEISNSSNDFFAYYLEDNIAGVIEIAKNSIKSIHIQSLVVYPRYFRKGIGKQLVKFVLDNYKSKLFTVETGEDNDPAINLYKSFNFKEEKHWDTDHGVRKVGFKLLIDSGSY